MGSITRKVTLDGSVRETPVVVCSECRRKTNHRVLRSVDISGEEKVGRGNTFNWSDHFQVIQCQGCDTISFRKASSNSEEMEPIGEDDWDYAVYESVFPPRIEGRTELKDTYILPAKVRQIYEETIAALVNSQPVLCGVGIRALLETVCVDRAAPGASLYAKINGLVTQGVLTAEGAEILHHIRTLGNKAAHEVKPHSEEQLALAMDVVEHLLQGVYILKKRAQATFKNEDADD